MIEHNVNEPELLYLFHGCKLTIGFGYYFRYEIDYRLIPAQVPKRRECDSFTFSPM